nr:unnamed protein product [Callosobruchus chinensis]
MTILLSFIGLNHLFFDLSKNIVELMLPIKDDASGSFRRANRNSFKEKFWSSCSYLSSNWRRRSTLRLREMCRWQFAYMPVAVLLLEATQIILEGIPVLLYILVHKEMKTEARQEKERYKNDLNKRVYIVDIQSLLLCLKSTVSLLYYKMKLVVHNNIKTKEAHSFIWNASEGGIGSNEFSSILTFFIQNKIKDMGQVRELMFYSKWMQGVIMYHSQTPYLNCPFNMTLLLSRDT